LEILELLIVIALGGGDGRVTQEVAHLGERDASTLVL
jgi:spermidine synthase